MSLHSELLPTMLSTVVLYVLLLSAPCVRGKPLQRGSQGSRREMHADVMDIGINLRALGEQKGHMFIQFHAKPPAQIHKGANVTIRGHSTMRLFDHQDILHPEFDPTSFLKTATSETVQPIELPVVTNHPYFVFVPPAFLKDHAHAREEILKPRPPRHRRVKRHHPSLLQRVLGELQNYALVPINSNNGQVRYILLKNPRFVVGRTSVAQTAGASVPQIVKLNPAPPSQTVVISPQVTPAPSMLLPPRLLPPSTPAPPPPQYRTTTDTPWILTPLKGENGGVTIERMPRPTISRASPVDSLFTKHAMAQQAAASRSASSSSSSSHTAHSHSHAHQAGGQVGGAMGSVDQSSGVSMDSSMAGSNNQASFGLVSSGMDSNGQQAVGAMQSASQAASSAASASSSSVQKSTKVSKGPVVAAVSAQGDHTVQQTEVVETVVEKHDAAVAQANNSQAAAASQTILSGGVGGGVATADVAVAAAQTSSASAAKASKSEKKVVKKTTKTTIAKAGGPAIQETQQVIESTVHSNETAAASAATDVSAAAASSSSVISNGAAGEPIVSGTAASASSAAAASETKTSSKAVKTKTIKKTVVTKTKTIGKPVLAGNNGGNSKLSSKSGKKTPTAILSDKSSNGKKNAEAKSAKALIAATEKPKMAAKVNRRRPLPRWKQRRRRPRTTTQKPDPPTTTEEVEFEEFTTTTIYPYMYNEYGPYNGPPTTDVYTYDTRPPRRSNAHRNRNRNNRQRNGGRGGKSRNAPANHNAPTPAGWAGPTTEPALGPNDRINTTDVPEEIEAFPDKTPAEKRAELRKLNPNAKFDRNGNLVPKRRTPVRSKGLKSVQGPRPAGLKPAPPRRKVNKPPAPIWLTRPTKPTSPPTLPTPPETSTIPPTSATPPTPPTTTAAQPMTFPTKPTTLQHQPATPKSRTQHQWREFTQPTPPTAQAQPIAFPMHHQPATPKSITQQQWREFKQPTPPTTTPQPKTVSRQPFTIPHFLTSPKTPTQHWREFTQPTRPATTARPRAHTKQPFTIPHFLTSPTPQTHVAQPTRPASLRSAWTTPKPEPTTRNHVWNNDPKQSTKPMSFAVNMPTASKTRQYTFDKHPSIPTTPAQKWIAWQEPAVPSTHAPRGAWSQSWAASRPAQTTSTVSWWQAAPTTSAMPAVHIRTAPSRGRRPVHSGSRRRTTPSRRRHLDRRRRPPASREERYRPREEYMRWLMNEANEAFEGFPFWAFL